MVKIDIRWADIDANRHLANSAYVNFMSHARVVEMNKAGITQADLAEFNLGPIIFYENIFYFREILPDQPVYVDLKLKGLSEDNMFFQYEQNLYNEKGQNMAQYEMMGAWIDMTTRKLTGISGKIIERFTHLQRTDDFKVLTKEDTRKFGRRPTDLSTEAFEKLLND